MKKVVLLFIVLIAGGLFLFFPSVRAAECNDGIDNDGDGKVDFYSEALLSNVNVWVEGWRPGFPLSGYSDLCQEVGFIHSPNSLSQACTSGENVIQSAAQQLGVQIYKAGCWPVAGCSSYTNADTFIWLGGTECYTSGQSRDQDSTDMTAAYHCRLIANATLAICNDGYDNNKDGLKDMNDPGCASKLDTSELMHDPDCSSPTGREGNYSACADGVDNDNDGLIDNLDPGCWINPSDPTTYDSIDTVENNPVPQCSDGQNNDFDSAVTVLRVKANITTAGGSSLYLKVGYYNGSWHSSADQLFVGDNSFSISNITSRVTLNFTFVSSTSQFYSPVLSSVISVIELSGNNNRKIIITNLSSESLVRNISIDNNVAHLVISNQTPYTNLTTYLSFDSDFNKHSRVIQDYGPYNNDWVPPARTSYDTNYVADKLLMNYDTNCVSGGCINFSGFYLTSFALNEIFRDENYIQSVNPVQFNNKPFAISGWFKTSYYENTYHVHSTLWSSGHNGSGQPRVQIYTINNYLQTYIYDSNNEMYLSSLGPVNNGQWHHFVYVRESTKLRLYIDGVQTQQGTISNWNGDVDTAGVKARIGNGQYHFNDRDFNGSIDEIMVFNGSLTAAQVSEIYTSQSPRFFASGSQEIGSVNVLNVNSLFGLVDCDDPDCRTNPNDPATCVPSDNSEANEASSQPQKGIRLYYKFEDNFQDSSGNNNHGTGIGNPLFATGKVGKGISLDGLNYVNTTNELVIDTEVSVSAWIKTTNNDLFVLGERQDNTNPTIAYSLHVISTGKVLWYISDGSASSYLISDSSVNDGNWHFVAATFKPNSEIAVYIDDVKKNSSTSVSSINTAVIPFKTGSGAGNQNFSGLIDEVKVWNYALNHSEISKEYAVPNLTESHWADMIGTPINVTGIKSSVQLIAQGTNLQNATITYEIYHIDGGLFWFDSKVASIITQGVYVWQAGKKSDGSFVQGDYYFKSKVGNVVADSRAN
ncbi:MAG: LamG domain-containing protein, partial [Nanoarchaeota archaeon]